MSGDGWERRYGAKQPPLSVGQVVGLIVVVGIALVAVWAILMSVAS